MALESVEPRNQIQMLALVEARKAPQMAEVVGRRRMGGRVAVLLHDEQHCLPDESVGGMLAGDWVEEKWVDDAAHLQMNRRLQGSCGLA